LGRARYTQAGYAPRAPTVAGTEQKPRRARRERTSVNWQQAYRNLQQMVGLRLESISGKTDIDIVEVDAEKITVRGQSGTKSRPLDELRRVVTRMDLGSPIHVDSVLFGSGSSRNQPETILANMPDVEWLVLNGRKHIVWVGRRTHELATLKQIEEFEAAEIRARFRGRGPLTGRGGNATLVRAREIRAVSEMLTAALQCAPPQPIAGTQAYRISSDSSELIIFSDPGMTEPCEFIPILRAVDKNEAVERVRKIAPGVQAEAIKLDKEYTLLRLPKAGAFAIE